MTKKLNYIILEDRSLIIEYYNGKFNVDELIDFKRRIGNDQKFDPNYSVLSDIRNLEFMFNIEEVKKYVDFLIQNQKHVGKRKTAMITDTPKQVVTSLGFDMLKGDLPIDFKVFSEFETAYTFFGFSISDRELVGSLLLKLKNTP